MAPIYLLSPTFQPARAALGLGQLPEALEAIAAALADPGVTLLDELEAEHLSFLVYFYSGQHQAARAVLDAISVRWGDSEDLLVRFHLNITLACWDLIVDFPSALRRIAALVEWQAQIPACDHPVWRGRLAAWHGVALAFNGRFAAGYARAASGCRTLEFLATEGSLDGPSTQSLAFILWEAQTFTHICATICGDLGAVEDHRRACDQLASYQPFRFFQIHNLSVLLRQAFRLRDLPLFEVVDRRLQEAHTAGGLEIDERYTLSLSSLLAIMNFELGRQEIGRAYWGKAEAIAAKISYGVSGAHFFQASGWIAALFGDYPRAEAVMALAQPLLEAAGPRSHQAFEGRFLTLAIQVAAAVNGPATLAAKVRLLATLDLKLHELETFAAEAQMLLAQVRALRMLIQSQGWDVPDQAAGLVRMQEQLREEFAHDLVLAEFAASEVRRLVDLLARGRNQGGGARAIGDSKPLHLIDSFARQLADADVVCLQSAFAAVRRFFKDGLGVQRVALVNLAEQGELILINGDELAALKQLSAEDLAQIQRSTSGTACRLTSDQAELYTVMQVPAPGDRTYLALEGGWVNPCFADSLLNLLRLAASVIGLQMRGQAAEKALQDQATLVAVGRTMQMLAHDVRKPFTLMKIGLGMLQRAKDADAIMQVRERLATEVERAIGTVDAMITDVLSISSQGCSAKREEVEVAALLQDTVTDVLRLHTHADIDLVFAMDHTSPLHIEVARTSRMLANIIDNGVQAMNGQGAMEFRTRDVDKDGKAFVELQINNSGSFIPASDLPRLFEPFFTKGKRNGTGLGLAIAHKVVTEQGGEIWCRSDMVLGTTFGMTLPAATPAMDMYKQV